MSKIPYLAAARFSGEDAGDFLQSQLSADIGALEPGGSTFACYCTPKGQVLGLLHVKRSEQDYSVIAAAELLPAVLNRLKMFVFRSRVRFAAEQDLCVYGRPGPEYEIMPCSQDQQGDLEAWKAAELRQGIVWLGAGSSEKFIPQMLGFDTIGAVSFSKGCYPGQEIVARARYLGKVKRKPVLAVAEGLPSVSAGARLRLMRAGDWGDAVVVDSACDADGRTLVFSVARADPEAPVEQIELDGQTYRCATI